MTEMNVTDNEFTSESKSVMSILTDLEIGQTHSWPVEQIASIRSMTSMAGLKLGRKYKTKSDRIKRTISVKRLS